VTLSQPSSSTARQAGSGVLWLTLAKFYFMGTGFILLIMLPGLFQRLSGDDGGEMYGRFRVVIGLVNLLNMVLIGGTIQAVSKFISEREERAHSVKWQTFKIQTILGGGASLALLVGAGWIASGFYQQPQLAFYLRLAAPIVLLYSYYAVIIGCLNGLKRFRHQAMMDMLFATLKVGLTVALVAAGFAIAGAIGGFLITALALLALSSVVLGRQPPGETVAWTRIFSLEWKTLFFAFFLNGLLQVDLQLLMALAPAELGSAESQAGVYGLALQMGQLPYIATISVAFVIFPLISRATFEKDLGTARSYVRTTNRYVFLLLAGVVAAFFSEANNVMSMPFFPKVYAGGSQIFAVLCVGYLFFAVVVVNANIFTGSGRPLISMFLFAGMMLLSVLLNVILIPHYGGVGAATAASLAMAAGFVAAGLVSHRLFKTFMPPLSLVRGGAAAIIVLLFARFLEPPHQGMIWLILGLAGKFVLYLALLALLREVTLGEIKQQFRALRKKTGVPGA